MAANWGQTYVATDGSATVNWSRANAGTSPNLDNMVLDSVSIYVSNQHNSQIRVAVYQGGDLTVDPSGATLIEDLGQTAGAGVDQWLTLNSATSPALAKNEVTWIGIKGDDSNFRIVYEGNGADNHPGPTDFETIEGRFESDGSVSDDETVAWPATWPADAGDDNEFWMSMYLTYSIVVPSAGIPGGSMLMGVG